MSSARVLVAYGNCQAESMRVLAELAAPELQTVRIPPVHELGAADLPMLRELLARTDYLISQPVVDNYRGMTLGSNDIRRLLPAHARVAMVPALRWAALMPTLAIIRAPGVSDPPAVPYHDLRTLSAAARGARRVELTRPSAAGIRAIRDLTEQQLRVRQQYHQTVDAATVFDEAGADAAYVINHPTNQVLRAVASLALRELGLPHDVPDPGRVMLGGTRAPIWQETLSALGLNGSARTDWVTPSGTLSEEEVAETQLRWYETHPSVVAAGLTRHADAIHALGLA